MDATATAVTALFDTLRENLPAALAALDASRASPLLPLATPAAIYLERTLLPSDVDVLAPIIAIESKRQAPGGDWKNGERLITLRLDCWFPGRVGDPDAVLEASSAFVAAIYDVAEKGDGRGPWMIGDNPAVTVCRPKAMQLDQTIRQDRQTLAQVARALPEFEIQVWV